MTNISHAAQAKSKPSGEYPSPPNSDDKLEQTKSKKRKAEDEIEGHHDKKAFVLRVTVVRARCLTGRIADRISRTRRPSTKSQRA